MIADAGFPNLSIRRAVTCGLELKDGEECVRKADVLAERLRAIFNDEEEVNVSRPVKKFEIKIHYIDDSVAHSEVAAEVASLSSWSRLVLRHSSIILCSVTAVWNTD